MNFFRTIRQHIPEDDLCQHLKSNEAILISKNSLMPTCTAHWRHVYIRILAFTLHAMPDGLEEVLATLRYVN
jgi:hypothetical protein